MQSNIASINVSEGYLIIEAKGGVRKTFHEVLRGAINLAKAIDDSGLDKVMLDYRKVMFEATAADIINITKFYNRWPIFCSIKSATLINQETLAIATIWLDYCQKQGFNFNYFLNPEEAKFWLLN